MKKLLGIVVLGLFYCTNSFSFQNFKALPDIDLYLGADVGVFARSIKSDSSQRCSVSSWKFGEFATPSSFDFFYPDTFINFAKTYPGVVSVICEQVKHSFPNVENKLQENYYLLSFQTCRGKIAEYKIDLHFRVKEFGLDPGPGLFDMWLHFFKIFSNKTPITKKYDEDFKSYDGSITKLTNESIRYDDQKNDISFYLYKNLSYDKKYSSDWGLINLSLSLANLSKERAKACF